MATKPLVTTFAIPDGPGPQRVIVKNARTQEVLYDIRFGDSPDELVIRHQFLALQFESDASNHLVIRPRKET